MITAGAFLKVRIQGLQTVSGRYKLAAIGQDDYIHGVAENQGNSFYLNIYGNDGDKYRFTLLDAKTGEVTDFDITYDFDAVTPSQVITISTTTDITPLNADGARKFWYGVDGIRMGSEKPSQKGIYINNSKKQTR